MSNKEALLKAKEAARGEQDKLDVARGITKM